MERISMTQLVFICARKNNIIREKNADKLVFIHIIKWKRSDTFAQTDSLASAYRARVNPIDFTDSSQMLNIYVLRAAPPTNLCMYVCACILLRMRYVDMAIA